MPLFRFHRGELYESLKTTVIVKNLSDMVKIITESFDEETIKKMDWEALFTISPYPAERRNFDFRIGWYTQIVLGNIYEKDKVHIVGFLSEPFAERA